ncbi:CNP1-like family protein [Variovorax sp. WS11]|uniref:CNP1-like family protein n=1 Tax=Variovorax sp. WS11 TaxID=1105204 RepID=UPI001EF2A867|nr:CNP1-like family protein [Variovorax sp. WS11]
MRRAKPALVLALAGVLAACGSTPRDTDNPDWAQAGMPPPPKVTAQADEWKEAEVPPPPAFSESRLIQIEMPPYSTLKFGVDPATLSVTGDGVVRYVVVASSKTGGGGTNAFYEGIRCASEEVRQYARYSQGAWQVVKTAEWKRIDDRTRYARELSRQGVCRDHAPRASVREMLQQMKNPLRELP